MINSPMPSRSAGRGAVLAMLLAGAALLAPAGARAGQCPADKVVADGHGQAMSTAVAKGVTDDVIASTNLAREPVGIANRACRLRRLVVQPGGIVPWHSHGDRPAIIYIIEGEMTEYASTCAVPIVHKPGDATPERHATSQGGRTLAARPSCCCRPTCSTSHRAPTNT